MTAALYDSGALPQKRGLTRTLGYRCPRRSMGAADKQVGHSGALDLAEGGPLLEGSRAGSGSSCYPRPVRGSVSAGRASQRANVNPQQPPG